MRVEVTNGSAKALSVVVAWQGGRSDQVVVPGRSARVLSLPALAVPPVTNHQMLILYASGPGSARARLDWLFWKLHLPFRVNKSKHLWIPEGMVPNQPVERMAAGGRRSGFHLPRAAAIAHFSRWTVCTRE